MGGEEMSKTYLQDLDDEVQELYGESVGSLPSLSLQLISFFVFFFF